MALENFKHDNLLLADDLIITANKASESRVNLPIFLAMPSRRPPWLDLTSGGVRSSPDTSKKRAVPQLSLYARRI